MSIYNSYTNNTFFSTLFNHIGTNDKVKEGEKVASVKVKHKQKHESRLSPEFSLMVAQFVCSTLFFED